MNGPDLPAVLLGVTVGLVGVVGEVAWPWIYVVAAVVLTGTAMVAAGRAVVTSGTVEGLVATALFLGTVSAVFVSGSALASKTHLASWAAAVLIWIVISRSGPEPRRVVSLCLAVGAVVLGASVVIAQSGAFQLMANPNIAVAMIISAAPLAFDHSRNPWIGRGWTLGLLFLIVLSGSRAGVLSVLVVVVCLWPAGRHRAWVVALSALGAAAAFGWRIVLHPQSLAWHRWRIWGAVVDSIWDRPLFGFGAGDMALAMGPYRLEHVNEVGRWGHVIGSAENMVLGFGCRVGLPALFLICAAGLVWFFRHRLPGGKAVAVVGGMMTMGLFHDFWSEPAVLWWWAAVLAIVTKGDSPIAENRPPFLGRWALILAVGGVAAWAWIQPAWAQTLWGQAHRSDGGWVRAVRAEPWLSQPMDRRINQLLGEDRWSWAEAAEAKAWARRLLTVRGGSARAWNLEGLVNARIVDDLGPWPAAIHGARDAFTRASALEPRLPWFALNRAEMERILGHLEASRALAVSAVSTEPNFVRGWLLLARLELDAGRVQAAAVAFEKALRIRDESRSRLDIEYARDLTACPPRQVDILRRELGRAES